jgi:hypothetical protein
VNKALNGVKKVFENTIFSFKNNHLSALLSGRERGLEGVARKVQRSWGADSSPADA